MAPPSDGLSSIHYRPLDLAAREVRILELQPSPNNDINDRIVCRLVHEKLCDAPDFIGLSALYGDITKTEPILLNGQRVAIPSDLAEAIRYTREVFLGPRAQSVITNASSSRVDLETERTISNHQPEPSPPPSPTKKPPGWLRSFLRKLVDPGSARCDKPPLRIWIDLLCINRRDRKEEAERRAHMARAYREAKLVVGWLGTKDATSDLAIEIIRAWDKCMPANFGEPGDREANPANYAPILQWMGPVAHLSDIPEGITDPTEVPSYKAISGFLNRPYFRNTWILDDIAQAQFPTFMVGDGIVSWMQILRLNRVNEDIKDHGAEMFPSELRPLLECGDATRQLDRPYTMVFNVTTRPGKPHLESAHELIPVLAPDMAKPQTSWNAKNRKIIAQVSATSFICRIRT
ncbi:heterokaryon incompatibility protein [Fusarium denticulatum]|uniref:Heterokaryon incompatibility protein n=1 Tax=Fusarium denticulatum TaxID=48507 RepID=A0A8H5T1A8_9HYPO|nr:heterokaryon incompatibility protein [Fusarium denticulatum]